MKWSKKFGIALHLTDYKEGKIIQESKISSEGSEPNIVQ